MGIGTYLGLTEAKQTGAHADTEQKTTRRLAYTAAGGTVATVATLAMLWGGVFAPAASAAENIKPNDVIGYEGAAVDIFPNKGTGGLNLRDSNGTVLGSTGSGDELTIQGCHPTDPTLAWAVQISRDTNTGGWGVYEGYIKPEFGHTEDNVPVPCGG